MPRPAPGTTRSAAAAGRDLQLPRPRLAARDAAAEAGVAGIVQRPGRAVLTMIGTILGVGAFVAVLGLTATGPARSHQFTVLEDTTVTVEDNGPANNTAPPNTNPAIGFPRRRRPDRRPHQRGDRRRQRSRIAANGPAIRSPRRRG